MQAHDESNWDLINHLQVGSTKLSVDVLSSAAQPAFEILRRHKTTV